ncbi:unnamed protein product [Mytilus coruscus]|uniref:C17orf113 probable zinc finger domain-containing protein n=1 Tax=Mytilus coruscus TaxID=42192 RepID=A0A6J8DZN1_MYTCO|nr:unnamed protein product [Mytilus coruscus]
MITNFFTSSHDPRSKAAAKVQTSNKNLKSKSDCLQNSKFKPQWSNIFPCIYFDADTNAMYCQDCKSAKMINSFTIGCQMMLKDNIQKHIKSADHKKAVQTKIMRTDWDQGIATANKHHEKEVTVAMSNIFWMGVESVTAIQKAKNTKYTSSDSVLDMQIALSKVVGEEIIEDMKASTYFSVMLDESTDCTTEKTLMLYVCYMKSNVSVTGFFSVVELSGGTADVIFFQVYIHLYRWC